MSEDSAPFALLLAVFAAVFLALLLRSCGA